MASPHLVSRLKWLVLGAWAMVSTALLVSVRGQIAEQSERLDALSRAVAQVRPVAQAHQRDPAPAVPPVAAPGASVPGPGECQGLSEMELETIAQRVASLVSDAPGRATPPALEETKPLAEGQRVALERASGTVDRILGIGQLTRQDVEQLRGELESLGGRPEADALRRRIAAAINQNKLQRSPDLGLLMP